MRIKIFCTRSASAADKNQPDQSSGQKSRFRRKRRKELAELTKLRLSGEIRVVEYILDHLYKSSDLF